MPSTPPWSPTFSFNTDPDPQNKINATALQSQLQALSAWCAALTSALEVSVRDDNMLTDELVRLRNLHPELAAYLKSNITGPIITEAWSWRFPVLAATTQNLAALYDAQTIDGVALPSGAFLLVKDQTIASQNGLWETHHVGDPSPHQAGIWIRRSDLLIALPSGAGWGVVVQSGTVNGQTAWGLIAGGTPSQQPIVGTDPLTFFPVWGPFPLPISRGGTGSNTSATALAAINGARKFVATITGNGVQTAFTVTHGWNTVDVAHALREVATNQSMDATLVFLSVNQVSIQLSQPLGVGEQIVLLLIG